MNKTPGTVETVIVTSDEPWSDIWHTQLHYAYQLSKRCRVIFIDPPLPWKISHLIDFKSEVKQVSEMLTVTRYKNFLPFFIGKIAVRINDLINELLLKKLAARSTNNSRLLIWHFDPFRSHFIFRRLKAVKHIYHVVDPIVGFHMDKEMTVKADLVIVTSPKFLHHYQSLNKNVIQIGQGADIDFFKQRYNEDELKSLISYDSILLLGTFSDEIDYRFLKLLANKYPGKLVLIGPDKTVSSEMKLALSELKSMDGVHWLGAMNPAGFHKHLLACKMGIITYTYSNYERNNLRSPLKVISYLACDKCIISNIDCELPGLVDKAVYIVNNDEAYFNLIDRGFNSSLVFDKNTVTEFLNQIDYNKLLTSVFERMNEELPALK